jgi:hypothetical protein
MPGHPESSLPFARWPELCKLALMLEHLLETNPGRDLLAEFEAELVERPHEAHERAASSPEFDPYISDFADRAYQAITSLLALSAALRAGVRAEDLPARACTCREDRDLGTRRRPTSGEGSSVFRTTIRADDMPAAKSTDRCTAR